jgi:hypothetical protein
MSMAEKTWKQWSANMNLSIDDCVYDKETQELKSRIGISFNAAPPEEIRVKGKTCIITFRFMRNEPSCNHTLYGDPQLVTETTKELTDKQKGIVLIMPWIIPDWWGNPESS